MTPFSGHFPVTKGPFSLQAGAICQGERQETFCGHWKYIILYDKWLSQKTWVFYLKLRQPNMPSSAGQSYHLSCGCAFGAETHLWWILAQPECQTDVSDAGCTPTPLQLVTRYPFPPSGRRLPPSSPHLTTSLSSEQVLMLVHLRRSLQLVGIGS